MKNPIVLFKDLTLTGKIFSWWILPQYYLVHLLIAVVGVLFSGLLAVISEIKGEY